MGRNHFDEANKRTEGETWHQTTETVQSFGWWKGKAAGDPRSFAKVVASPVMGGGGGRYGGRGNYAANRGHGRHVWNREYAQASSSAGPRGSGSQRSGDRWEIAAREFEQRRQEAASLVDTSGKNTSSGSPAVVSDSVCSNCKVKGHLATLCSTARCERCKKLGHVSQVCQAVLPWECIPQMCAFQSPGMGFFYIPDSSTSKHSKERSSSVVIIVIEGNATARELEMEFNIVFGDSWRCTARSIGPNQYTMGFPNPREVERAIYYGASMELKTTDATVRLSTWTASVGAKAALQKAWVRISNIPLDKRTEANVFFVGALVGVSLDFDAATLHKPEYVRVLIGCRDVELIPAKAEGCLGDNFYDFFYEIDKVVVAGPPKQPSKVAAGGSSAPSPKRARMEQSLTATATEEASEEQAFCRQYDSVRQHMNHEMVAPIMEMKHESEEDSAVVGNELLIETLAREHEASLSSSMSDIPNKWLIPCSNPAVNQSKCGLADPLSFKDWPSLPTITDVSTDSSTPVKETTAYLVQSPDSSPMEEVTVVDEVLSDRFSQRLQADSNAHILDKVVNISKKRNLEGLQKENDKAMLSQGASQLMQVAAKIYSRSGPRVQPYMMIAGP